MQTATADHASSGGLRSPDHIERALISRARALVTTLQARAPAAEALRKVSEETHADFRKAGFYKALQPKAFGGFELPYGAHTVIAMELARGCASSSWAYSVTASHAWILGMFPREAQEDVWGRDPDATIASTFLPAEMKAEPVDGGLRLSGRWRFSSDVEQCQACIVLVALPQERAPPKQYFALLTREQYEIEDTWNVIGLAASASNDVVVERACVPWHRLLDVMSTRDAATPGAAFHPGDLFHTPLFCAFAHSLVGVAVGGAEGALDILLDELQDKTSVAQVQLARQQSVQLRIAEARAEVEAARALLASDRAKIIEGARTRTLPDYEQRVRYRLNTGYAAKLAVQAVERLLPLTGGRGLEKAHGFQRMWRDVHAVVQHIALVWDVQALNYGAVRLGFQAMDPRI